MSKIPQIKVLGIGSTGIGIIERQLKNIAPTVELYIADSDREALEESGCPNRLQIVCDTYVDGSLKLAAENRQLFEAAVKDTDMLVLVAGHCRGIDAETVLLASKVAKESGTLTVAVVCTPFEFGGEAEDGAQALKILQENSHTVIQIPHEKLITMVPDGKLAAYTFKLVDFFLKKAVLALTLPIAKDNAINLDFYDIRPLLLSGGNAFFGQGITVNRDELLDTVRYAVNSSLSDRTIEGARGVIAYIDGGNDLTYGEIYQIADSVHRAAGESADLHLAVSLDGEKGKVALSVVAVF